MEKKINLYLVRHGETFLNRYKRMQGWADSPLTEEGKAVAIESGKKLSTNQFNRVYTSDSGRTLETAELILQQNNHKIPVINKTKAFRETFFGGFEGENSEVAWSKIAQDNGYHSFKDLMENCNFEEVANLIKKSDPFHHAESYVELWERIENGLNEIISTNQNEDENILIVTHGNTIRTILKRFSNEYNHALEIKNASVSILEHSNNLFKVISYNQ